MTKIIESIKYTTEIQISKISLQTELKDFASRFVQKKSRDPD